MQSSEPSSSQTATARAIESFEGLSITDSCSLAQATVKIRNALSYIDAVKARFAGDEQEVYDEFLILMRDFKNQRVDTVGVVDRVKSLFCEHPDLVTSFDNFLPPGYSTSGSTSVTGSSEQGSDDDSDESGTASPGEGGSRAVTPTPEDILKARPKPKIIGEPTIAYIQRVKQQCDTDTWEQFMVILSRQYDNPDSFEREEMIKDVEELFEDHPELIPGFQTFLTEVKQDKGPKSPGEKSCQRTISQKIT